MKIYLKICENSNCWEVMWGFPRTKCQFCWSKDFSIHRVNFWLVLGWSTWYHHENRNMWILRNYKWLDHLFIRVKELEVWSNNCDHNWWYIHIIWIDNVDEVERFIEAKIKMSTSEYIFK